jgi:hypothetical protein
MWNDSVHSIDATAGADAKPELSREERRRLREEALRDLASVRAFRDIEDPVEWQREIRKDRPLPGREE